MFNIILLGVVCFFCAFGVVEFFRLIMCGFSGSDGKIISVIPLLNDGKSAEGIVRSAFYGNICSRVIAVDFGSTDDTLDVLNNMSKEYSAMSVMTKDEFLCYIKDYYNGDEF